MKCMRCLDIFSKISLYSYTDLCMCKKTTDTECTYHRCLCTSDFHFNTLQIVSKCTYRDAVCLATGILELLCLFVSLCTCAHIRRHAVSECRTWHDSCKRMHICPVKLELAQCDLHKCLNAWRLGASLTNAPNTGTTTTVRLCQQEK